MCRANCIDPSEDSEFRRLLNIVIIDACSILKTASKDGASLSISAACTPRVLCQFAKRIHPSFIPIQSPQKRSTAKTFSHSVPQRSKQNTTSQ